MSERRGLLEGWCTLNPFEPYRSGSTSGERLDARPARIFGRDPVWLSNCKVARSLAFPAAGQVNPESFDEPSRRLLSRYSGHGPLLPGPWVVQSLEWIVPHSLDLYWTLGSSTSGRFRSIGVYPFLTACHTPRVSVPKTIRFLCPHPFFQW